MKKLLAAALTTLVVGGGAIGLAPSASAANWYQYFAPSQASCHAAWKQFQAEGYRVGICQRSVNQYGEPVGTRWFFNYTAG